MRPMLATRGVHVPTGESWTHEVKWDGMRILADASPRGVRLTSRNENDVTVTFPELHGLAGRDLLLDGEVVAFDEGRPSFGALADRMHVKSPTRAAKLVQRRPVTYLVFDLVRLDGRDLSREPLSVRREALLGLGLADVHWQVPGTYDDGDMLFEATREQGLEGIVSKRLASRYEFGQRSPHWLKFPHRRRASYVVGGWRPETDSAHRLGALLVGEPTSQGLVYRGRVGSGIAGAKGPVLRELLEPLARADSPFVDEVPRLDALGTRWVEPVLVVDVEALGLSSQQRLRQPSFRGLRADLTPEDLAEDA
ncbi:bifunctional non-homologous end joining protein LigD [Nocardioides ginsengisegetis]|uniref:DNA ligase (ATP) n=1 Tax=Nocardioides ginsengisegetis TaxID=661491 RepID=A0A7W3J1B2_9ACTN|nr:non-homologous end-joining DNA ligase [Nocardioides ginsengisegetis]MBA8804436.1 bifunctional non-homologous end joining protein LigD [Nocardioides ginsengisegetis]